MTSYDAIIIGTGQAGPALADRLSRAGQRVAVIERARFGGTCVNTGCIPTKTMVASAYAARMAQRAAEYGVVLPGPATVDMKQVKARKDGVSGQSRVGVEGWMRGLENGTVIQGHARLTGPRTVQVGDETLTADRIFLNVGGRATVPPMPGIKDVPFLTNSTMMDLDTLPEHLVIVGGSYIGLEFGQMFRRFGSRVTIIEQGPRLIGREDEDVSAAIAGFLEKEGIVLRTNAKCLSVAPDGDGVAVTVDCTAGAPVVVGSHLLLAVGRRPNTQDLGLETAGVAVDERGYITVDDTLQTSVPGIWALGDCNGRGAFTHTAYNDFEIVAANLLDGDSRRVSDRITAYALYTDPPLGRAGMTEAEARRSGRRLLVAKRPMARVGRAVEKGETEGFMKVVVDAGTRQILGAAILGTGGDEVVHGLLDLMYARAPVDVMQRSMPIHPTVSELLPTLLGSLEPAP
ncbi:FAD-containing oxidoreductase [Inquilinus limosus]|uniref:Mercuric reductase n=1 Tax=Inquilinus limosus TaxID=171674 RepID=A0A211ZRM2_9PROT|nr:FAD-containing oxidoreductase [Inquilinus limosus]OWJ67905.1 mercuric reductase [Inquilinus limosus]